MLVLEREVAHGDMPAFHLVWPALFVPVGIGILAGTTVRRARRRLLAPAGRRTAATGSEPELAGTIDVSDVTLARRSRKDLARSYRARYRGPLGMLRTEFGLWMVLQFLGLITYLAISFFAPLAFVVAGAAAFVVGLGGPLARFSRRLMTRDADDVRRRDPRPPVLLLRSFTTDTEEPLAIERTVADRLWDVGPVVAAARPMRLWRLGEAQSQTYGGVLWTGKKWSWGQPDLPAGGAARTRVPSSQWQDTVTGWIRDAALIVVVLGQTEGLRWELERLKELGREDRLLCVVPPLRRSEVADRDAEWASLRASLGLDPPYGPGAENARAVVPALGAPPTIIVSRSPRMASYDVAVATAAAMVLQRAGRPIQFERRVAGGTASLVLANLSLFVIVVPAIAVPSAIAAVVLGWRARSTADQIPPRLGLGFGALALAFSLLALALS